MKRARDRIRLAAVGTGRVLCRPSYAVIAAITALIFLWIFNLLATGNTFLQLLINLPWLDKISVIGEVYANFGLNILSIDRILMLLLSLCQGVLVALTIFSVRHRHRVDETSILEGGFATLLALLGAGCPLCGGSLVVSILALSFGMTAYAWLQTVSIVVVILAFVPMLFALRRMGSLCYTLTNAERIKNAKS